MDKKRFEQILREGGIQKQSAIDEIWQDRPRDIVLDEEKLRLVARATLKQFPEIGKKG